MKNSIIYLFLVCLFSCESVSLYEEIESKIVVDGWIMDGQKPQVLLSYSSPYIVTLDSSNIYNYSLARAKVTLISEGIEEVLVLNNSSTYFPNYVYESLSSEGHTGREYQLHIKIDNNLAVATTYVPDNPELIDVKFVYKEGSDSLGFIECTIKDPSDEENYYRILTKRYNTDPIFYPAFVANIDDDIFTDSIAKIPVYKGIGSNLAPDNQVYFSDQDIIQVRVLSMSAQVYNFWVSAKQDQNSAGNPLAASHQQINTNIEGGIGIWAGYGVAEYIIYPE